MGVKREIDIVVDLDRCMKIREWKTKEILNEKTSLVKCSEKLSKY